MADGSLTQKVTYMFQNKIHEYVAEGEDLADLERDWAYKYLELFE